MFVLPSRIQHSPQRKDNTVGLVRKLPCSHLAVIINEDSSKTFLFVSFDSDFSLPLA